jgi:hypothetical protein
LPLFDRPVAGGVRGEDLVDEQQLATGEAELELGVGEDDPALGGVVGGAGVDVEGQVPEPLVEVVSEYSLVVASSMLTSWPLDSLVAGVKIGSPSLSASLRPAGRCSVVGPPPSRYSRHDEP